MNIKINPNEKIVDLKKQFHSYFPFLKIEFFNISQDIEGAQSKSYMLPNETNLSEIMDSQKEGSIEFSQDTKVGSFEKMFKVEFGLNIQVFRKSGQVYLETILTDDWSLFQQNEEGKSVDKTKPIQVQDMTDRDKWE